MMLLLLLLKEFQNPFLVYQQRWCYKYNKKFWFISCYKRWTIKLITIKEIENILEPAKEYYENNKERLKG